MTDERHDVPEGAPVPRRIGRGWRAGHAAPHQPWVPASDTAGLPTAPLLEVTDLRTTFRTGRGTLVAVDGVSLRLERGETLGVVG